MKELKQPLAAKYHNYFSDAIPVGCASPKSYLFDADLYGYIDEPSQFSNIISVLNMMEEGDTFTLNLQSGGGSLDATDALIHAMRKTKGDIHIVATGNCSSAATLILLEAHSFELSDGFNALLHCGSLGTIGNLSEYKQQTAFYGKFMENTLRNAYCGFLSEKEIADMLDGKDIWVNAEEWTDRHEQRNEFFKKEVEKLANAYQALETQTEETNKEVSVKPVVKTKKKPVAKAV